jgi:diguanylate cyclase (GGDEF)-like protein
VAVAVGVEGVVLSLVTANPAVLAMSLVLATFAAWVVWAGPKMHSRGAGWFVLQLSIVILTVLLALVALVPGVGPGMTAMALLPIVIGLPYLPSAALRRMAVLAWLMCVAISLLVEVLAARAEPGLFLESGVLRVTSVAVIAGVILLLLWQFRDRLSESARDTTALMRMSRDLSSVHDPQELGLRMARHIAIATGADACMISRWMPDDGTVRTFGVYPFEGLPTLEPSYDLARYPLTRRVLESGKPVSLHVAQPDADPNEVAFLRTLGHEALLMLPLAAKGKTVGLVELTSSSTPFTQRVAALASMLAAEAAMALENARLYDELRHQAFHDGLTGLANRGLFLDRLEHALVRGERRPATSAVLLFDVDEFKSVNDRLGHAMGDRMLATLAERLRECIRAGDSAARLGGDEFAVLLEELDDRAEAELVAHRIVASMALPVGLEDTQVEPSVSLGVCFSGDGGETADTLLRNADFAMYQAKRLGKGQVQVFRPSMRISHAHRQELEVALRGVVEREELRLQYQPIVSLETGRIQAVEALVRWDLPGREGRLPGEFIGLAEETGQIRAIGLWVLRMASRQIRRWHEVTGRSDLAIGINLSAHQFQHPSLAEDVDEALRLTGVAPGSLIVEITESTFMQHTPTTEHAIHALRDHGVRVAVDDFGVGYSSLSYLQRFPIDVLKIDQSFVRDAAIGPDGGVLARAIVEIGAALGMQVIAEGIEHPEQLRTLRSFGCELGQGYLFSHPLDAPEFEKLLVAQSLPWEAAMVVAPHAGPEISIVKR